MEEVRSVALSAVLASISGSSFPQAERKRLAYWAVVEAVRSPWPGAARQDGCIEAQERVLDVVAKGSGVDKVSVSRARELLRRGGDDGRALANRLGRLSKFRNAGAHPDVALERDVEAFMDKPQSTTEDEAEEPDAEDVHGGSRQESGQES